MGREMRGRDGKGLSNVMNSKDRLTAHNSLLYHQETIQPMQRASQISAHMLAVVYGLQGRERQEMEET